MKTAFFFDIESDGGGIFQLADGTYMVGGATYSNNGDISGNHNTATADGFLIKLTAANLANDSFGGTTITTYPNPTKDFLHIELTNELSGKITDLTGKTLMTINTKDIDISSLPAGIYLLDITSEDKHHISKIVKQ
jgi:hypothetical protein